VSAPLPGAALFPYPTLFRSRSRSSQEHRRGRSSNGPPTTPRSSKQEQLTALRRDACALARVAASAQASRRSAVSCSCLELRGVVGGPFEERPRRCSCELRERDRKSVG